MKVVDFTMENTGCFTKTTIPLALQNIHGSNITVFTGYAGSGKSLLLKSLANALSWFIARLRDDRAAGTVMPDTDIRLDMEQAKVEVSVHLEGLRQFPIAQIVKVETKPTNNANITISVSTTSDLKSITGPIKDTFSWNLLKVLNSQKVGISRVNLDDLMTLVKIYRDNMTADSTFSIPVIAYYPVERWVMEVPVLAKTVQPTDTLSAYDNGTPATVNFTRFFEWFRDQEDLENERRAAAHRQFFNTPTTHIEQNQLFDLYTRLEQAQRQLISYQLDTVRQAIASILPEFSNLHVERQPKLRLVIDKYDETVNVAQLSQGEKIMLAMVGDIARRLATQNPSLPNPLEGNGIVMIDEIALHLHPDTQQVILQRFAKTFPNCQLVVTTLSPEIYRGVPHILCYALNKGRIQQLQQDYHFDSKAFFSDPNKDISNSTSTNDGDIVTDDNMNALAENVADTAVLDPNSTQTTAHPATKED